MKYLDPKTDLTFKKIFGNHPKRFLRHSQIFEQLFVLINIKEAF